MTGARPRPFWVVGRGLLGGRLQLEVERVLPGAAFAQPARYPWDDLAALQAAFARDAAALATRTNPGLGCTVAWTAGAGVIGSPAETLERDLQSFEALLGALAAAGLTGALFVASTAGGIWGGSTRRPVGESEPPAPITEYGRARLRLEESARRFCERTPGWRAVLGRISTLYGPGQDLRKPQGFISQVTRAVLHDRPVHVYVPLDTLRDFLFAPDCARSIVRLLGRHAASPEGERCTVRLLANEQSVSLHQVVSTVARVSRRRVRLWTHQPRAQQGAQAQALLFRSEAQPPLLPERTDLTSGISLLYQHQLQLFMQALLPPPPATSER